jgi:hypothetical protein
MIPLHPIGALLPRETTKKRSWARCTLSSLSAELRVPGRKSTFCGATSNNRAKISILDIAHDAHGRVGLVGRNTLQLEDVAWSGIIQVVSVANLVNDCPIHESRPVTSSEPPLGNPNELVQKTETAYQRRQREWNA